VSLFNSSKANRWMLPISSRRRLTLQDLQRANELRAMISGALDVDASCQGAAGSETKPVIQERLDIRRRLGELLLELGRDPLPFEERDGVPLAAEASLADMHDACLGRGVKRKAPREFGDVWINVDEIGAPEAEPEIDRKEEEQKEEQERRRAEEEQEKLSFFSFESTVEKQVKEQEDEKAKKKREKDKAEKEKLDKEKAEKREPERMVLLPELTLPGLLQERASKYRLMQVESKEMDANTRNQIREAKKWKVAAAKAAKQVEKHVGVAKKSWDMAVGSGNKKEVCQAMDLATSTMREVGMLLDEIQKSAFELDAIRSLVFDYERQASEGLQEAPQFWKAAARLTKAAKGRLDFQRDLAVSMVGSTKPAKQAALQRADDTVKLVNDKLRRWADEERILHAEAAEGEALRLRKLEAEREIQRQQEDQRRMQEVMAKSQQQRLQEMWGYAGVPR